MNGVPTMDIPLILLSKSEPSHGFPCSTFGMARSFWISVMNATSGLNMSNTAIQFKARFGGIPQDIYIPVENIAAIYASENGQGMGFEPSEPKSGTETAPVEKPAKKPTLTRIK